MALLAGTSGSVSRDCMVQLSSVTQLQGTRTVGWLEVVNISVGGRTKVALQGEGRHRRSRSYGERNGPASAACFNLTQRVQVLQEISTKANVFFLSLSHKTLSFNGSVIFPQYSQARRSSSFHKYFLSVVSYKAKYSLCVNKGNLLAPWFNVSTLYTLYSCT